MTIHTPKKKHSKLFVETLGLTLKSFSEVSYTKHTKKDS